MINKYCAGLMFDPTYQHLALISKTKGPAIVVGKLNALGGKCGLQESSFLAMQREFREESGVVFSDWKYFLSLGDGFSWQVDFFYAATQQVFDVATIEVEKVDVYAVSELERLNVVPNLRWIVPMATSFQKGERALSFLVTEG